MPIGQFNSNALSFDGFQTEFSFGACRSMPTMRRRHTCQKQNVQNNANKTFQATLWRRWIDYAVASSKLRFNERRQCLGVADHHLVMYGLEVKELETSMRRRPAASVEPTRECDNDVFYEALERHAGTIAAAVAAGDTYTYWRVLSETAELSLTCNDDGSIGTTGQPRHSVVAPVQVPCRAKATNPHPDSMRVRRWVHLRNAVHEWHHIGTHNCDKARQQERNIRKDVEQLGVLYPMLDEISYSDNDFVEIVEDLLLDQRDSDRASRLQCWQADMEEDGVKCR